MGLNVYEIFQDVNDAINKNEGGYLSVDLYNRLAWKGQLRVLDWLSGDVAGVVPPEFPFTQKALDWLSDFITKFPVQVTTAGEITKPNDYYLYNNLYKLNGLIEDCDSESDEPPIEVLDAPITLLENSKFKLRVDTYIESLKPTITNPVAKVVGRKFEFYPKDIGSVVLEYVRYPLRSVLVMKVDPEFNDEVYDSANSIDFEWQEYARPVLVWFIVDAFFNYTRDVAGKQMNAATPKLSRT